MPGWGWGAAKLWELRIWNFLNGNSCLFKMYSDFILFFNWWMSIFSHVLIVMSGISLVPYGFAVLNSCLVITASAVISPCTALLNVDLSCSILCFFWVFLSGWRWLLHLFVNPQNISVLGKMMPLSWYGTWVLFLTLLIPIPIFACIIRAGDWESIILFSELCPGVSVHIPGYSLAPVQIQWKLPEI